MFLDKYLSSEKFDLLYDTYEEFYIEGLDYNNFNDIYSIFVRYDCYYIDDIILNYLEIFTMDKDYVLNRLEELRNELGDNFIYVIGKDMRYLDRIVDK